VTRKEKLDRITSVVQTSSEIKFDHVYQLLDGNENEPIDIYYAKQNYPHVMEMFNPFTYERTCIVIDKINGKIVKSKVEFKSEE
jgi:hypothetical protein